MQEFIKSAKQQDPSTMERSFTELRSASFPRSIVRDPRRLSRVKMNALGAPLTASQDLTVTCANFLLDAADDFIDECYKAEVVHSLTHKYTVTSASGRDCYDEDELNWAGLVSLSGASNSGL